MAASGVTAIAGFGVLVLSDIRMLRDFGLVTLIDLSVSLRGCAGGAARGAGARRADRARDAPPGGIRERSTRASGGDAARRSAA